MQKVNDKNKEERREYNFSNSLNLYNHYQYPYPN